MKRFGVWLLCLLLALPCIAGAEEPHLLTGNTNEGSCRSLTGEVLLAVVFVSTPQAQWKAEAQEAFRREAEAAAAHLEQEAAAYGAQLSLQPRFLTAFTYEDYTIENARPWAEETLNGVPSLAMARKLTALEELPVLLCLPGSGRCMAYSAWDADAEFAVLYSDADAGAIRHELLHLYGAQDYYIHDEVKAAAQKLFPASIMMDDDAANLVDSFTACCIGWLTEPDDAAALFMAETAHLTQTSLDEALEAALYTGYTTVETDDGVYTGTMLEGLFHGEGTFRWADGTTYTGQWQNGLRHGTGTLVWAEGSSYTGSFVRGERSGTGVYTWPDGTSYTGDFANGERTGHGVLRWPDGVVYTGDFVNGSYTGKGVLTYPDFYTYTGDFLQDEMTGTGVFTWADGSCHTGGFLDGFPHGQGVFIDPDGSVTTGVWEYGVLTE